MASDNVTVNDKSMHVMGKKLTDGGHDFNAKEQQSQ